MAYSRVSPGIYRDTQTGQLIKSPTMPQAQPGPALQPMPKPIAGQIPNQWSGPQPAAPGLQMGGFPQAVNPEQSFQNPGFKSGPQWTQAAPQGGQVNLGSAQNFQAFQDARNEALKQQMGFLGQGISGFGAGKPGYDGLPGPQPGPVASPGGGFEQGTPGYNGQPTASPQVNPPQQFERVSPGMYRNTRTGRMRVSATRPQQPQGILGAPPQGMPGKIIPY
jgi:hypothetical protein